MTETIDRVFFLPNYASQFYNPNDAVYMGKKRWIQSVQMAEGIVQKLDIKKTDTILELGCSSGYQASLLSLYCRAVYTVDNNLEILKNARETFNRLEIKNIHTIHAPSYNNLQINDKFDRIVLSFAVNSVDEYIELLSDNGMLIVPLMEENDFQLLTLFTKSHSGLITEYLKPCIFLKMEDMY